MRNTYIKSLIEAARKDPAVYSLTADTGILIFDDFIKEFPGRFINVGIAEANMIGLSSGLALSGKIPFCYAIASFLTMRAFEQIRVDVCCQDLNVKIVGVGGGFVYGTHGPTHHCIEDIAILRALPNMTVICPADPMETAKATAAAAAHRGPVYIRLGKNKEPAVYTSDYDFKIGKAVVLRDGRDAAVISTGITGFNAMKAAELLEKEGISVMVINMHTVKPLDRKAVIKAASATGRVITVEEHTVIGGLGSAVAEVIAEEATAGVRLLRLGIQDKFVTRCASHPELQDDVGISARKISAAVRKLVKDGRRRP